MAVLGAIGAFQRPRSEGAIHDPTVRRRYGIVVGIEFVLAVIGNVVLSATLTAVAAAALLVGVFTGVEPSSVTGAGAGLTLLIAASVALAYP